MAKIGNVRKVRLQDLTPYAKNARIHDEKQVDLIARSIQEFGFLNPVLIDGDGNVIAGHGRIMAAEKLGMQEVPCLSVDGLTEEQRRAYILADNRLTEMGGWDQQIVSDELQFLKDAGFGIDLTGFDIDDIIITDDMGADISDEEFAARAEKEPRIKRGEVWILGRHRLMCGDSTSLDDCQKLVGGGTADLLLTDPPYNVNYEGSTKNRMRIDNDNLPEDAFIEFLTAAFKNAVKAMRPGASFYIWYSSKTTGAFLEAMQQASMEPREQLIWVKNTFTLGRQDYQWRHEPCFYGWVEGAAHYFIDMRSLSTVNDDLDTITREKAVERIKEMSAATTAIYENKPVVNDLHPTMKPILLFKKLIRNSTKPGETVLDLFGGSGTTLLAAEEMDRSCMMMEYDPRYADVIIQRWEEMTGETASLEK